MTEDPKPPAPAPPKPLDVEVKNPRYEGATIEMVAKALLRRPRKPDRDDGGEASENESDS